MNERTRKRDLGKLEKAEKGDQGDCGMKRVTEVSTGNQTAQERAQSNPSHCHT